MTYSKKLAKIVFQIVFDATRYTTLSKSIDFFPFPKKPWEISPSRMILRRSGTKKKQEISHQISPERGWEISRLFFLYLIYVEILLGEISRFFFG